MTDTTPYLRKYAETEALNAAQQISEQSSTNWLRAVVIPAFDESSEFVDRLKTHANIDQTLVIVVVNRPHGTQNSEEARRTQYLYKTLAESGHRLLTGENFVLNQIENTPQVWSLLVFDYCTDKRGLNDKQGVGLARKIGTDTALALISRQLVHSSWIYSTDADACLPDNYFDARTESSSIAAVHCSFKHAGDTNTSVAQKLYDLSLDYYVCGLGYAGSRYAHYSVGSALIINSSHYAQVRGFPKRAAAEDFYLLNKLAKTGRIIFDPDTTVLLQERHSNRTPFGTGQAVAKISQLSDPHSQYQYYHPDCFEYLKLWLNLQIKIKQEKARIKAIGLEVWMRNEWQSVKFVDELISSLHSIKALHQTEQLIKRYDDPVQFEYQQFIAFDALKTLRLIHQLRDRIFGSCTESAVKTWLAENGTVSRV